MNPSASWLWEAFRDASQMRSGSRVVRMSCRDVGSIALPTGRIVACDPFTDVHTRDFGRRVEPDSYPVFLAVADYGDDERVAGAMILFRDQVAPSRWEPAAESDPDSCGRHAMDVDSGRGCYLDLELARALHRKAKQGQLERYQGRISSALEEHSLPTWSWADVTLDEVNGANVIAFTTGMGDGSYSSYFGFKDGARPVCLLTDFGLIDGPSL